MIEQVVAEISEMIADDICDCECDCRSVINKIKIVLSNYNIELKKKELICVDDSWKLYLERYILQKMIEGKTKKTLIQYTHELKRFLMYTNKNVCDITEMDVYKYILYCKEVCGNCNKTVENKRLILRSFFSWSYKSKITLNNPMDTICPIKTEKVIKQPFSDEERHFLFENCKNTREQAIVEFLYSTWVRVSELINIKIDDY